MVNLMTVEMDDRELRRVRKAILRRIQDYLYDAHDSLGADCETVDMVDVLHHEGSRVGSLNYLTPRRGVGWVSGQMVARGLEQMQDQMRRGRVRIIGDLFPPMFGKIMDDLGLRVEWQEPLTVYVRDGLNGQPSQAIEMPPLPQGLQISSEHQRSSLWRYIQHSPHYNVTVSNVEPLFVDQDSSSHIDVTLSECGFPVGVARIGVQKDVGHILAYALTQHSYNDSLARILQTAALQAALDEGCALVFSQGGSAADQQLRQDLGFLDFGSMICYAASPSGANEEYHDDELGQPVLAFQ